MANSLSVEIGFKSVKDDISQVLGGVRDLNTGVKEVVLGMKGLNSETKELNKHVSENNLSRYIMKFRGYASGIKDVFSGFSGIGHALTDPIKKQFGFVRGTALAGDHIAKTSRLVGMSVKNYQAFSSAAKHAGMSSEEMDGALRRFNVNLGKARGGDRTAFKMFDAILGGKALSDFKDTPSLIAAVADGYLKLGTAEQKAFVTQELFGRSGAKIAELLSQGDDGIKKLIVDFESHGGGFSEKGAKNAEEFEDALQDLSETFNSLKIKVAEEVFPTFTDLFKTVGSYIKNNSAEIIPKVREIFVGMTGFVKDLLPKIPVILDKILSVVDFIGPKTILIGTAFASILPSIFSIVLGVGTILPIIIKVFAAVNTVFTYVRGIFLCVKMLGLLIGGPTLAAVGLVVGAVLVWGKVIKDIYDNWEMLTSFIIDDVIPPIRGFFIDLAGTIGDFCSMAADKFLGLFEGLGDVFLHIGQSIMNFCSGAVSKIFGFVHKIREAFSGIFGGLPQKLQSLFGLDEPLTFEGRDSSSAYSSSLGASVAQSISESHTTTTSRFAVDFKNMPRGVQVTPPDHGDFDYSRGYVLGGA